MPSSSGNQAAQPKAAIPRRRKSEIRIKSRKRIKSKIKSRIPFLGF